MAQSVNVIEREGVRLHVFLGEPTPTSVVSVLLETADEVALVDAQFGASNARRLAGLIRATGKPLTTIFISHSDPDYYFGLGVLTDEFPEAKILATPQTVWLIGATKDDKLAIWGPRLGGDAPARIVVPEALTGDNFTVGGLRVEVKSVRGDEGHSWLLIPSIRAILGGSLIQEGEHLWVADTPTPRERTAWLAGLDEMEKSGPRLVIPGHLIPVSPVKPGVAGVDAIGFVRKYLVELEKVLREATDSAGVISRMSALYPHLAGRGNLEMSAKVLKGEMEWKTVRAFPPIARRAEVDFGGEYLFELDFTDHRTMTFRGLKPRTTGRPLTDTVQYTAVEVAPGVYMVYWTERDNTHVVHVEDYGDGVAYTNIAAPDGSFANLRGKLRLLE